MFASLDFDDRGDRARLVSMNLKKFGLIALQEPLQIAAMFDQNEKGDQPRNCNDGPGVDQNAGEEGNDNRGEHGAGRDITPHRHHRNKDHQATEQR